MFSVLLHRVLEERKVFGLEEGFGGADRVRGVGYDDVVFVLVFRKELEAIANVDSDLWVFVACRHDGEVLLRHSDDGLGGTSV